MKITESQLRQIVKEEMLIESKASDSKSNALDEVLKILLDIIHNDDIDENVERKLRKATVHLHNIGVHSK
jgi:hypothetical protein